MNKNRVYATLARGAFTLVEILLSVTILMMVFNLFYFYMQSQNRQILTIVQKSEMEELTNLVMQQLSNDVKSAKRGSVVITPSSLTMDRFIEAEPNSKQSAQLALMRVEYFFDEQKKQLTRKASKYDPSSYDETSGSFKTPPKLVETKTFNKISEFDMTPIPMPTIVGIGDINKHLLGVDAKIASEAENVLTTVSQRSFKEDRIYVMDEIAFKNQPFWNQNPKYTKVGPVSLKFTDALTINLSQLEFINWLNGLKTAANVRLAFENINNQIMTDLSNEALKLVNPMYPNFMSRLDCEVKKQANAIFADRIARDYSNAKDKVATALLLKDYILAKSPADCRALKNRILSGALEEGEIKNLIKNNAGQLKKYEVISDQDLQAIDDATCGVEIVGRVSRLITSAGQEMPNIIFKYVETLSLAFANDIKKQLCAAIGVEKFVRQRINELVDPAIDELLSTLGVKAMIDEIGKSELDDPAKIAINAAVDAFKGWLKEQITQKLGEFTAKLLDTVTKSFTEQAQSKMTQADIERMQRERSIGDDIGGAVNDTFSAVTITIAKNLLLGNKYDEGAKSFVTTGARDHLNGAFKDFGYDISSVLDGSQQDALRNDEQIRRVESVFKSK